MNFIAKELPYPHFLEKFEISSEIGIVIRIITLKSIEMRKAPVAFLSFLNLKSLFQSRPSLNYACHLLEAGLCPEKFLVGCLSCYTKDNTSLREQVNIFPASSIWSLFLICCKFPAKQSQL